MHGEIEIIIWHSSVAKYSSLHDGKMEYWVQYQWHGQARRDDGN